MKFLPFFICFIFFSCNSDSPQNDTDAITLDTIISSTEFPHVELIKRGEQYISQKLLDQNGEVIYSQIFDVDGNLESESGESDFFCYVDINKSVERTIDIEIHSVERPKLTRIITIMKATGPASSERILTYKPIQTDTDITDITTIMETAGSSNGKFTTFKPIQTDTVVTNAYYTSYNFDTDSCLIFISIDYHRKGEAVSHISSSTGAMGVNFIDNSIVKRSVGLDLDDSEESQFKGALHILDRWVLHRDPTCDLCEANTDYYVARIKITDALDYLESTTGIESNIEFSLGTVGIMLTDGSSYVSDKKKWQQWWDENRGE
ncbi:MAG: hypothetical protein GQ574_10325 [Crocinitomix sp.]|nr:hypothetical protein [Crocinitomix sp.]